jgi:hypothetical protein
MKPDFAFNPPEWNGRPKLIAELWRLTKDGKLAYCVLQNHPTRKAEIRCHADGELRESRADNDPLVLFALADEWKAGFKGKDWCDCACHQGAAIVHIVPCCDPKFAN